MKTWLTIVVSALSIAGCDDGGGSDTPDANRMRSNDAMVMGGAGGEMGGAGGEVGGAGGEVGGAGGEMSDASLPDMEPRRRPVENCVDACEVLGECDRLDLAGGSAESCAEACALASEGPRFQGWLSCVELEACGRLDQCPIPEAPPPACDEVCTAIDGCEEDFRLPTALPDVESCAQGCEVRVVELRMGICGEALVRQGVCDELGFARCMLEDRAADCLRMCDAESQCSADPDFDPIECAIQCATAQGDADPVVQLRVNQRIGCFDNLAGNCEALQSCIALQAGGATDPEAVAAICGADEACGFFGEPCDIPAAETLAAVSEEAADCLVSSLEDSCESPLYACFAPAPAPPGGCRAHCEVSELCGLLPEGQDAFGCQQLCDGALASGEAAQAASWLPLIECAGGATCPAIEACQAAAEPMATCESYCGRLDECEALGQYPDAATCQASCEALFLTDRARAARLCASAAAGCDQLPLCETPPAPDCTPLCTLLEACDLGGADCQAACDDATFARPESYLERLACAAATDRCDERATCEDGELGGGLACLRWCEATVACEGGDEAAMVSCVQSCGAGLPGVEGLTFAAAEACLQGAEETCEAVTACVDGADVTTLCDPYCAEMDRCRLIEEGGDVESCVASCGMALEAETNVDEVSCTLGATRRQAGCGAVAECNGIEVEPASPACQSLCGAQNVCDPAFDAFLCERDCIPEPAGTPINAACANRAACDDIGLCLAEDPQIDPACVGACAEIAACEGLVGPGEEAIFADEDACAIECAGGSLLNGDAFAEGFGNCARDARMAGCSAEEIEACFDNPADICTDGFAAILDCNLQDLVGGEQAYLDSCRNLLAQDPAAAQAQAQCYIDLANAAMGDDFVCLLGSFQCLLL
ncbi:MAG: hypothetical protein ACE366_13035 [Bradymonadia bacterium]